MSTVASEITTGVGNVGAAIAQALDRLGDLTQFSGRAVGWMVRKRPLRGTLLPVFFNIGVGSIINSSIVRELGPVLAATMLAGRVGSAMAAQLGTMRITEQIDALECLGVNPIHYLVVPRLLACVLLNPLLTVMADIMGILGGAVI